MISNRVIIESFDFGFVGKLLLATSSAEYYTSWSGIRVTIDGKDRKLILRN